MVFSQRTIIDARTLKLEILMFQGVSQTKPFPEPPYPFFNSTANHTCTCTCYIKQHTKDDYFKESLKYKSCFMQAVVSVSYIDIFIVLFNVHLFVPIRDILFHAACLSFKLSILNCPMRSTLKFWHVLTFDLRCLSYQNCCYQ